MYRKIRRNLWVDTPFTIIQYQRKQPFRSRCITAPQVHWAIQCYAAIFFALIYGFSGLGERWHKRVISATAASKTFGLSSLRISNFLIPDPTLRQRFLSRLDAHGLDVFNALSVQAATTAWNESRQWLDSLLNYLAENRRWFVEQAAVHLPWARIVPAQGTYLLWMDCKKLGLDDEQLKWVMADVAGIAPSMGSGFGPAGSGFIRLNLGCPRTYLEIAMDGLKRIAVKAIKGAPTGG